MVWFSCAFFCHIDFVSTISLESLIWRSAKFSNRLSFGGSRVRVSSLSRVLG